ncbi:MAG: DUF4338 domain-containing protein [Gammaproteobacteria bacterium]|nr:DUF4338 domain-containing protein [Gammaproteobacteria bacterium]NIP19286.1 DUF4338 domain-containing protein [Xanthomonadales bacterium]NIP98855.1 DUF4338 domain-containing protein [Akkermansiaceae bacterium]NIT17913.1 DUF4338 domain-containing protein [Gammaproteobacteria bacterium]NIX14072.1 DUF4338 domain-containing protein [Xanthomonadales bacterium]
MKAFCESKWAAAACGPLSVRVATEPLEIDLLREALREQHPQGAGRPGGQVLWQGVYEEDEESGVAKLCAVLCWAGAALRLKDRDEWIGWDPVTRANRLGLVVQLRRFLVLEEQRRPNLASRCLGLAMRELCTHWQSQHGFRPLVAESFSDPESHAGTVYKVTNWEPIGMSAGYSRQRRDFYRDDKHPKALWVRELSRGARGLLGSPGTLPEPHRGGVKDGVAGARSALKCSQLRSLAEALRHVPDPRSKCSRRYPIGAMLGIIALGLMGGADTVMAVWRKAGPLSQPHRRALGLMRRDKSGRLKLPSYDALNKLLAVIDPDALAETLNAWLAANEGLLPRSLAFDGKSISALRAGMVTLCHHHSGAPVAMATYLGAKDDCEMPVGRRLLKNHKPSLDGAVVTGDPLHCQKKTARAVVENGGDYIFGLKDNQPTIAARARQLLDDAPPL